MALQEAKQVDPEDLSAASLLSPHHRTWGRAAPGHSARANPAQHPCRLALGVGWEL